MDQTVIRYWKKKLNLEMVDWRTVYLLGQKTYSLKSEIFRPRFAVLILIQ
jgi:hypothetical protein